jgi:hypothetical protein
MINTPYGDRVFVGPESELVKPAIAEMLYAIVNEHDDHLDFEYALFDNLTKEQKINVLTTIVQALFDSRAPAPPRTAVFDASIASIFATIAVFTEIEVSAQQFESEQSHLDLDPEDEETTAANRTFWRTRIIDAHYHRIRLSQEADNLPQDSSPPVDGFGLDDDGNSNFITSEMRDDPEGEDSNDPPLVDGAEPLDPNSSDDQNPASDPSHEEDGAPAEDGGWNEEDVPLPASLDLAQWEFLIDCMQDGVLFDQDFMLESQITDEDPEQAAALRMFLGVNDGYFTEIAPDESAEQALKRLEQLLEPHFKLNDPTDS